MNKNKKQILLTIITLLISTTMFANRVDAIVMWMQCTDKPDKEMYHNDDLDTDPVPDANKDYKKYNTIALINNINSDVRHLIYVGSDFYEGVQGPTYALYTDDNGKVGNQICWYNSEFYSSEPNSNGPLHECDKEEDFISVTELNNGMCPNAMYQTKGWNTSGGVKGDFAVLVGKKKPVLSEELTESSLVIYGFKDEDGESGIMIEGYNSSGLYGYATTWEDWDTFVENLNLDNDTTTCSLFDLGCQLINEDEYDDEFMSWTAMTQARRIAKFGRNYFKLLDNSRPWLVGTVDGQELTVVETIDGKNIMYRSDDNNNNFYNWVSKWYEKYDEQLSEQIEAMKNLKSEKYQKAYDISKEISKAVDEGKKYNFDENYSPSQMVLDLNDAYQELNVILSNNESMYDYYDDQCNLVTNKKTNNALAAITTQFNCELFNTSSITKLKHKAKANMLNELIVYSLNNALNKHANSDISIETLQSTAQDYAKMYTIAIKYIKKNEILTGEAETLISTLEESYTEMSRNFGTEVIIDCEDLIGKDLREKIGSYLNIVKIAVPIILIVFGIIDFTKAMFAGDEEKMKKAQKDFIMRLAIAILFFLVPTIVDFLLGIANEVWNFIEPSSCGIFNN